MGKNKKTASRWAVQSGAGVSREHSGSGGDRGFLPSIQYVPCFVLTYHCSCFLVFSCLDISNCRLMWVWMVRYLSRSLCRVCGHTSRLAPPLALLPPLVHGQL